MSYPATHTPDLHGSPRLLTVLPPYSPPHRTRLLPFKDMFAWLDLLTTILGAPSAVPPELWGEPLDANPKATLVAILRHVQTRIPLIEWELVDFADSVEELSTLHQIPIYPLGFDTCNGDIEGYGPATSLLAHLDGFEVPDLLWCPAPQTVPDALNLAPLLPALDALPPPLNGIAVIVAMLHHTTGTMLLDACPSCYATGLDEMLEWTDDNLTWLEQDAALAERIHKRAFDLEAWVAQKPLARLKTIWHTIRRAHRAYLDAPPVYRGPFTISAEDFVAGKLPTRPKTLVELWADVPPEEHHVLAPR